MPFKPGQSGNPKGRPRRDAAGGKVEVTDTRVPRRFRGDGWMSLINGLGNANYDRRMSVGFGCVTTLTDAVIRDLWRGNWLAKKAIEKLPANELRPGFTLTIKDDDTAEGEGTEEPGEEYEDAAPPGMRVATPAGKPDPRVVEAKALGTEKRTNRERAARDAAERIEQITQEWEPQNLDVFGALRKAREFQRAYGASAILLGVEDNAPLESPLNLDRVRALKFLTVLEKQEFAPKFYYGDPFAPKYGKPEIYEIMPTTRGESRTPAVRSVNPQVHETRLIVFRGPVVSNIVQQGPWPDAGDSVLQSAYDELRNFGIGWSAAATLLADFAPAVLTVENLAEMLSADDPEYGADAFVNRMRMMELAASVARTRIIGKNETYERKTVPVTGMAELLIEMKSCVAGALGYPVTEIFGESAKGLNATGEGDRTSWQGEIAASRKEHVIPALTRIVECQLAATGRIPERWCVEGNPLEQMTAKEQAEIEKLEAEADHIRVEDMVVSPEEVAVSRFKDGKRGLTINFDAREELLAPAAKPVTTEGVDPDLEPPPVIGPNGEEIPHGATIMDPPAKPEAPGAKQKPKPAR